ncbi:GntR family transcriptional regulator [Aeromicrobium sp. UC242_57]|uniref:GntR family transcriptional regulator n=1 Tax=Aeromicrobium sp. UC242_57 TaxID=3374624 RepID=UPI00379225EF
MARISTTDRVFSSLRESIVSGEFPAGSLHSIYRLADLLEVSRTPVRDAVLRLADLGLVTIERNRGVRIRGVSVADVRAAFELRLMLEVPAAALAARHADATTVEAVTQSCRRCGSARPVPMSRV